MTSSISTGKEAASLGTVCSIFYPSKICIAVWKCLCFYGEMFAHCEDMVADPKVAVCNRNVSL